MREARHYWLKNLLVALLWLYSASLATANEQLSDFVAEHCGACHGQDRPAAALNLVELVTRPLAADQSTWERVLRKIHSHQMPPQGETQPNAVDVEAAVRTISVQLEEAAKHSPHIAAVPTLRRLTRTEYQNAIRDLLGVTIDATKLLPPDESSHGFDNITVGDLSPAFLNRAISAAQGISHLAVGGASRLPRGETVRVKADITQEEHMQGLPIGTRGGIAIDSHYAQAGQYEITVRLARDRNEEVEGLSERHELEILIDRKRVELFVVEPPAGRKDFSTVDAHLKVRTWIESGAHSVGVTFPKKPSSLVETKRQPYHAHYNMHRHPRLSPAVYEVSITGPFSTSPQGDASAPGRRNATSPGEDRAHRSRAVLSRPNDGLDDFQCAEKNLRAIMRLAYRRPVVDDDLQKPRELFAAGRASGGFNFGMEQALAAVLVSPNFLFKIESDPNGIEQTELLADQVSGSIRLVSDIELATRLAFFLWSSLPDEELLQLAEQKKLRHAATLRSQVHRMLRDKRSASLVNNFAQQWLYLRNLDSMTPDLRMFPDFDDNLRQAFRTETELCFESVLREDSSVLELIQAEWTFLNERLAQHYGIDHVYGDRFRRVKLDSQSHRGGLLRQGSILTVTSYATRTSPVIRGHWILKNLVGSPPPPPPADVPALRDQAVDANLPMRARLAEHRAQAACAVCHDLMDPVGFSLENYDAIGRWRDTEDGHPIDAQGGLAGHSDFDGVAGLERALLAEPQLFVGTLTEKLITFALGRGIEPSDGPAIRRIVRNAADEDYRLSAIVQGIVASPLFLLRSTP